MNRRVPLRIVGLCLILALLVSCGSSKPDATNATGRTFSMGLTSSSVTPLYDYFGTGPRVIFSTAAARKRPDTTLKLTNTTATAITLDSVTTSSPVFVIDAQLPNAPSIAPHDSISIPLAFRPASLGVTQGTLSLAVADGHRLAVTLAGLNTKGIESSKEASLQSIFDTFGYSVDVAIPPHPPAGIPASKSDLGNSIGMTNSAVGDEVLAPLFTKADVSKPVSLVPVANYQGRTKSMMGWIGINNSGSTTQIQRVLAFRGGSDVWGGENQQLLPGYGDGTYSQLVSGSSISFQPQFATFGIADQEHGVFSQDQLNYKNEHSMRVYPAKTSSGSVVPNTYLIGEDQIAANHYKNADYQDFVFVISNVRPAS